MAENKTKATKLSVAAFIKAVPDATRRSDAAVVVKLMQEATKLEPVMWGPAIIGFGTQHYKYESGREGDMPLIGFSPRKQNLTLYITSDFDAYAEELKRLGPHSISKACLYIKRLADIDMNVLKQIVVKSVSRAKKKKAA
jgi:hypothetical protein